MAGDVCSSRAKAVKTSLGGTAPSKVSSIVGSRAKQAGHGKGTSHGDKGVVSSAGGKKALKGKVGKSKAKKSSGY